MKNADWKAIGKQHGIFYEKDLRRLSNGPVQTYTLIDNEDVVKTGIVGDYNALIELGNLLRKKGLLKEGLDLTMDSLKFNNQDHCIYVHINGKQYRYTPNVADKAGEIYSSVVKMAEESTEKAFAFLKKNAIGEKINEGKQMNDLTRLRQLSGIQPTTSVLEQLRADRDQTIAAYDQLISSVERGHQLDEGLFTNLKATFATLGHLTGASARKVADVAKKVTADVKEIYVSNKAKAELELLVKSIKKVIADFEVIEKDSSTIIKRDPEVAKEMQLFASLLNKLLETLSVRLAMSKGGESKGEEAPAEKTDMRDLGAKDQKPKA